jgi:hypothetical protein
MDACPVCMQTSTCVPPSAESGIMHFLCVRTCTHRHMTSGRRYIKYHACIRRVSDRTNASVNVTSPASMKSIYIRMSRLRRHHLSPPSIIAFIRSPQLILSSFIASRSPVRHNDRFLHVSESFMAPYRDTTKYRLTISQVLPRPFR